MTISRVLSTIAPIDGWLSSHEGYLLYGLAKDLRRNGEIVEIGSWLGKSTICLAAGSQAGSRAKVTAIDPHKGEFSGKNGIGKKSPTFTRFEKNLIKAGVRDLVVPLLTTSERAEKTWKRPIALLFIDGLHDYQHTLQDFSLWEPHVMEGGVVAFHDAFCGHIGPEKIVLQKILKSNKWSDIGVVGSIIFAKKAKPIHFYQKIDVIRCKIFISLALKLHHAKFPTFITFFLIHRIIKLLLLNRYTWKLLTQHI